jgi:hypothetical protein
MKKKKKRNGMEDGMEMNRVGKDEQRYVSW